MSDSQGRWERSVLLALIIMAGAGCSSPSDSDRTQSSSEQSVAESEPQDDPMPALDLRSPDSVVKSHWAIRDWGAKHPQLLLEGYTQSKRSQHYVETLLALGTGEYLSDMQSEYEQLKEWGKVPEDLEVPVIQRDIIEVVNESETRAVVHAKIINVTPIPSGRTLPEWNEEQREYGTDVRYVVEKTDAGWRLAQAWKRNKSDIELAKLTDAKTDGWQRVWVAKVPKGADDGPSDYHYSTTEP